MNDNNLWGELPEPIADIENMPLSTLQEQAIFLGRLSRGLLMGRVSDCDGMIYRHSLKIIVPLLNYYSYTILTCTVFGKGRAILTDLESEQKHECNDETEFREALQKILQSDEVRKVLGTLLAQARAECDR
ncbi:MAG: hypothetical protein AAGA60_30100 [Cyanobacteria bacterium P01_E01_bin.42]